MRFDEGDVIKVNGRKYEITGMDLEPYDDAVLQYDLKALGHDVPARLKPHSDGLTLIEYRDVEPTVIDEVEE